MQAVVVTIPLFSTLVSLQLEYSAQIRAPNFKNPGSIQRKAREMKNTGKYPTRKDCNYFVYNTHKQVFH